MMKKARVLGREGRVDQVLGEASLVEGVPPAALEGERLVEDFASSVHNDGGGVPAGVQKPFGKGP
jgi:hypothetical protein